MTPSNAATRLANGPPTSNGKPLAPKSAKANTPPTSSSGSPPGPATTPTPTARPSAGDSFPGSTPSSTPTKSTAHTPTDTEPAEPTPASDWLTAIGADVHYGGDRAYYAPNTDRIYCPALDQFDDPEAFWSTVLHEHIHWTGHHSRLDRLNISAPFGSPDYAAEELVAELGAAIAAASLDLSPQPRADHAAYLAHWLDILNEDPKALFRTAAAAQRAVDHLHQLATEGTEAEEVAR